MITARWILTAVAAVILLRIGGLISNFWTALGIIGFLVILALLQTLPAFKRFASAVFIGWVVFSFGLPMLSAAFYADRWILGPAVQRRDIDNELRAAQAMDPVALEARRGITRYCREVDRAQGEWLSEKFEELRSATATTAVRAGLPAPPQSIENNYLDILKVIEERRRACDAIASGGGLASGGSSAGWREAVAEWFTADYSATLWAVVVMLILAAAIAVIFRKMKFWDGAKAVAAIVVIALLLDAFALGGVRSGRGAAATPFKGVSRIEVPLGGGRPVPVDRLVRGGWCYSIRRGTAENLRILFADSSSNPESFGNKHVGWREIRALVADSGTAAIEVYPPTRGSCNPNDATRQQ